MTIEAPMSATFRLIFAAFHAVNRGSNSLVDAKEIKGLTHTA